MTMPGLETLVLQKGNHGSREAGVCLMEAVAWFAGEPHTDRPECVSPILRGFGINLNDEWSDDARQKLVPIIPLTINTAHDGHDEARGYMALDWLIRTYTPAWLDLAGLSVEAQALRDLRRIVDLTAAQTAGPVVKEAHTKAAAARAAARDAAWDAARAAAGAAAWAAAGDAAWDAAGAAAGDAAWAAAGDAAWDAAWDAAGAAARDKLAPTVAVLQDSAVELFRDMCLVGKLENVNVGQETL